MRGQRPLRAERGQSPDPDAAMPPTALRHDATRLACQPSRGSAGPPISFSTPANCRAWFDANLPLLRHIAGQVCRKARVSPDDADDFASDLLVKLIEHDYEVLRRFEGRCALPSYLHRVAVRALLDWRASRWGKWRPSAAARRAGTAAVDLERLTSRDGLSVDEALQRLRLDAAGGATAAMPARLRAMASAGALRTTPRGRGRETPLGNFDAEAPDRADAIIHRRDASRQAQRIAGLLHEALTTLSPDDRLCLRLRFVDAASIAGIARHTCQRSKPLYRRIAGVLTRLRRELTRRGLGAHDVGALLDHPEVSMPRVMALAMTSARTSRFRGNVVERQVGPGHGRPSHITAPPRVARV